MRCNGHLDWNWCYLFHIDIAFAWCKIKCGKKKEMSNVSVGIRSNLFWGSEAAKMNKIRKRKLKLQLTDPEFGVKKIFTVQTKYALKSVEADLSSSVIFMIGKNVYQLMKVKSILIEIFSAYSGCALFCFNYGWLSLRFFFSFLFFERVIFFSKRVKSCSIGATRR